MGGVDVLLSFNGMGVCRPESGAEDRTGAAPSGISPSFSITNGTDVDWYGMFLSEGSRDSA